MSFAYWDKMHCVNFMKHDGFEYKWRPQSIVGPSRENFSVKDQPQGAFIRISLGLERVKLTEAADRQAISLSGRAKKL